VKDKVSKWWYLLPIFFAWLGGIIGYFAVRHRDKKMAENLLIAGLIVTVIPIILIIIAGAIYYATV
jgi:uncharacterized membrane protein YsdA (DUF1294 family)